MAQLIMPGERINEAEELAKTKNVVLGPGLRRHNEQVIAYKAGLLQHKKPNIFWIDNYQRRYVPARGDTVIGLVKSKVGDNYRIDIGCAEWATISYLAFENSTKKNRPDINPGDLIYARILNANRDIEPELVCVNSNGKRGKLGILNDGFMFTCSLNLARMILREDCPLLAALTKEMPFEIAVGINGRIWVKAKTLRETIGLCNAILAAEHATYAEIEYICTKVGNLLYC